MMQRLASASAGLLHLQLTSEHLAAFQTYADELADWNARFNLTTISDPEAVQIKHFLDSLTCLLALHEAPLPPGASLIDVGAGAGFPGLPLKIVCPEVQLTLLEATGKKVKFLDHLIARLRLNEVTALKARAEEVGHDPAHREQHDWALARAVAELPVLVEYLLPLVRVGGRCLAQKGTSAVDEARAAERAMKLLGGRLDRLIPVELPGLEEPRYLVVIEKVAPTPARYPRRPGLPAKNPLGG
jgi:16S rRNA (guanine527-N7)-methyltransferase